MYKVGDIVVILLSGKYKHKRAEVIGIAATGAVRIQIAKGLVRIFHPSMIVLDSVFSSQVYQLLNKP